MLLFLPDLTSAGERPVWWESAEAIARKKGYRLIDKAELRNLFASQRTFTVLDVRPDYEYGAGHLPKAVQLEVGLEDRFSLTPLKKKQFENALGEDLSREIVIYCKNYT